jgi:hypothetical protein
MTDLAISAMPSGTYADALLIPAVDLTQEPGARNVKITAANLAPVRSVAGRTGNVVVGTGDIVGLTAAIASAVAAALAAGIPYADLPESAPQVLIKMGFAGIPTANQVGDPFCDQIGLIIPANFAGSGSFCTAVPAGDDPYLVKLDRAGTVSTIGTLTFHSSGPRAATWTAEAEHIGAPGDVLYGVAPASPQTTNPSWSILANRP